VHLEFKAKLCALEFKAKLCAFGVQSEALCIWSSKQSFVHLEFKAKLCAFGVQSEALCIALEFFATLCYYCTKLRFELQLAHYAVQSFALNSNLPTMLYKASL
jgi:hypothetical protein